MRCEFRRAVLISTPAHFRQFSIHYDSSEQPVHVSLCNIIDRCGNTGELSVLSVENIARLQLGGQTSPITCVISATIPGSQLLGETKPLPRDW